LVVLQTVALAAFGLAAVRSQRAEAERDLRGLAALSLARGLVEPLEGALARVEASVDDAARAAPAAEAVRRVPPGALFGRRFAFLPDGSAVDGEGRTFMPPTQRPPSAGAGGDPGLLERLRALERQAEERGSPADAAREALSVAEASSDPEVASTGFRIAARAALLAGEDGTALKAAGLLLERHRDHRSRDAYPSGPGAAAVVATVHLRRLRAGAPGASAPARDALLAWRREVMRANLPRTEVAAVRDAATAAGSRFAAADREALERELDALDVAEEALRPWRAVGLRARILDAVREGPTWVPPPTGTAGPLLRASSCADGGVLVCEMLPGAPVEQVALPLLRDFNASEGTQARLLTSDRAPLDGGSPALAPSTVLASAPVALPGTEALLEIVLVDPEVLEREAARGRNLLFAVFATSALALGLGALLVLRMVRAEIRFARMKADFVASVSHELKTPLTSIRMFLETLREGRTRTAEERQECLDVMDREAHRLERMVERVLEFSRLSTGVRKLTPEPCDPGALARDAASVFQSHLGSGTCDFKMEVRPFPDSVALDRDAVTELLLNLLDNAWKYTPATGKHIRLTAAPGERGGVRYVVEDNGPGVPPAERERIFEEFYRMDDPTTSAAGGTGLGLALARRVATGHGGTLTVEDAPGGGARFVVFLPGGATPRGGAR
jgi:signal transduction histidine kinase